FADRRLIFEDRLEDALAELWLIRRIRREQLATLQDGVDDRRDVVVVDPRSEERQLRADRDVLRGELLEVRRQLLLGHRRAQVELSAEPDTRGEIGEELLDRRDPDFLEHRVPVGVGQREIAHASARCCLYASRSSSESTSPGSLSRTRTSQPAP